MPNPSSFILRSFALIFVFCCYQMQASQKKITPPTDVHTRAIIDSYIGSVSSLMANNNYDSAYMVVTSALSFSDTTSYSEGKYYLYAFQSEILYYNSLFSPALNSGYRALMYAQELKNDTLIGSIENLIGLLLSNLNQYDDAEAYLRSAVSKIPVKHGNENLSFRFHAASNLCGVFLHKKQIDSVLLYANISLLEATELNRFRATAIDYWNIAKAYLQTQQFDSAFQYIKTGKTLATEHEIEDVQLFFVSLEAEMYSLQSKKEQCLNLLRKGISEVESNSELTTFSKLDFLNDAVTLLLKHQEYVLASKTQVLLTRLKNKTDDARIVEQIKILERFYANEKQLALSETLRQKNEAEAKLSTYLFIGTLVTSILLLTIIGLFIKTFVQRQNLKTLALKKENETLALQKDKEKIEERIEATNSERNRIAKELHDDIGSSLSSISIYSDVALKELQSDSQKSKALLEKVNQKSKELSENMSDIIWAIYSKNDSFNNLMMRMKNFAFEITAPLNIEIEFQYPFQLDVVSLNLEQRKNLYYIFKEAINNSVKHSGCNRIEVSFAEQNTDFLVMTIKDNGTGFNIESTNKNNGFYTLQSRAKQIGGNTTLQSAVGEGTAVIVTFPLVVSA